MNILGVETSCDETAMAILDENRRILAHSVLSQIDIHREFGGVVPEIAARNHADVIDMVFKKTLADGGLRVEDLDVLSATTGPGLIGSVIVGTVFAETLAMALEKPFVAVNHLEAHALTCRLTDGVSFPFFLFLLSGGHCQLLRVNGVGDYSKIGETLDDSLGETFDKVAQMLGLEYPGGPKIEKIAKSGDEQRFRFPRPLVDGRGGRVANPRKFDFSFSGLKTAVSCEVRKLMDKNQSTGGIRGFLEGDREDLAASFQRTVVEILSDRLQNVLSSDDTVDTFVLAGGVAANQHIAKNLGAVCAAAGRRLVVPPPKLCTDNGVMVANAALERYRMGFIDGLGVSPRARWELEELKSHVYSKFS
ncbi:MAG: tRNA (adenosine(37)-N6)-threonylcarbamoyltransferase complex transferase subunit TsaD [Rickettsiales bacterium]|jgi:N6-L-threonylcarbamoyladenine synthase|nr:tRNA (adenosine(37)-N6)-threonylcarbamoyltransferase complex transferase subunit TsaD [Rickettsiales bacterium]